MLVSKLFMPVLKENPQEAQIVSHKLMLRAGMIRQLTSGIYNWLPLGLKVLQNISKIIREELNKAGAQEILMPIIQPTSLWHESGRSDGYGKETLRMIDRHDNPLLFSPTGEEVVTDIFRKNINSYKQLPMNLYQIQWKFRDEIRPRFGVMRGREFLMKDAYTFDLTKEDAEKSYYKMFETYLSIFKRLGLKALPIQADPGVIGGSLSHEFHILAETGESDIYYDQQLMDDEGLKAQDYANYYAMADEMHIEEKCPVPQARLKHSKGIEIGHIFYLGTKYSESLKAQVTDGNGKLQPVEMGCFGIGVSRLVGGIIEASNDERGIVWPKAVAPFICSIIPLKKDEQVMEVAYELYSELLSQNFEILFDDTDQSAGSKFATHELIGVPLQIIIGPKKLAGNKVECKIRATGELTEVDVSQVIEWVKEHA
ncbi:proline--tRNA ligase [Rickettsiales endosymbiont of Stachyamoeba lipophora]|uniref:proline--tRNA ligase n=1 Tax=Rickettsiales endosymbiont of Stachyamoeba lipophora TaxID=2486578 RepID=UPI000F646EA1|nr:proline--tRNA ligase [Rickettsiales endosymbiont of Stachyamoeba lipophora]AZL15405.1 proline--tRNA ligase [Rickettsiales endosymbiont of Stachyamoeba lipophora]